MLGMCKLNDMDLSKVMPWIPILSDRGTGVPATLADAMD